MTDETAARGPAGDASPSAGDNTAGDNTAGDRAEAAKPVEMRYRAAVGAALVAGAFSLFVAGLLVSSHVRGRGADLIDPPEALTAAKKTLVKPTTSAEEKTLKSELTGRIRELDLELRRSHRRRTAFKRAGAWLLLGGIVVLVTALQFAAAYGGKPPHPEGTPLPGEEARAAGRARLSVGVLGVVLVVAAVAFIAWRGRGPGGPDRRAVAPPSGGGTGETTAPAAGGDPPRGGEYPSPEEIARNWPRFRGPTGSGVFTFSGVSTYTDIPSTWSGETGENIPWKTPLPLDGASSPVIWGKRIFLTGADKTRRVVLCIDAGTGETLWTHDCAGVEGSPEKAPKVYSKKQGYAASTPVTDGRRVYAIFASGDILAVDFDGKRAWARALGLPRSEWGFCTSLAMWRARVILQFDQSDEDDDYSSILAFDAATGRTVWETERKVPGSWASPIVIATAKGDRIITAADPWAAAYDPATGKELWRAEVLAGYVAPSPIFAGGTIYTVMADSGLAAIRPGGEGNVTATHILWMDDEATLPDTPTPVSDGKLLFTVSSDGVVTCFDAKDGVALWEKELDYETYVSPSLVGRRLFVVGDNGAADVMAASRKLKTIAENRLGKKVKVSASPAFAAVDGKGRMYVRTDKHLYCIGKGDARPARNAGGEKDVF